MKNLFKKKETGILTVIIILGILITLKNSVFLSSGNLIDLFRTNTVHGIVALGMLLVIITGGIDVSVGAMTAAVTVIIGTYMASMGGNLITVLIIGCVSGIILGLINGFFVAKLKIPAIVVTLGTMSIFNGALLLYTNGSWITDIPQWFIDFGKIKFLGMPIQIYFWIGAALLTHYILNYTRIGRGVYAIGGNPDAAMRVGFRKDKILIFIWAYLGFLVGLAAVIHTSIMRQVDPNAFAWFELTVIAAVVLGGANILGGDGSVLGTFLGIIMLAVIDNGLILAWIPTFWQQIIVGSIILFAVSYDVIQSKLREKKMARIDVEV